MAKDWVGEREEAGQTMKREESDEGNVQNKTEQDSGVVNGGKVVVAAEELICLAKVFFWKDQIGRWLLLASFDSML